MSPSINLFLSLLVPIAAGFGCLRLMFRRQPLPLSLHIALSYGLGLGLLAVWMLCLYIANVRFGLRIIQVPVLIVAVLSIAMSFKQRTQAASPIMTNASSTPSQTAKVLRTVFAVLLLLYVAQTLLYAFWRSLTIPVFTWDAVATVATKAKIFTFEETPPLLANLPHQTYPLFTPFMESWIAFNLGAWDDILIKTIFPCALLSYVVIQYKFLAHFTNRTWGLLSAALLLSSNFFLYHGTIGYRDFFLSYFNCTAIMLLLFWKDTRAGSFLVLAGAFAGFASFTKLEGTAFVGIQFLLLALINFPAKDLDLKGKFINMLRFTIPGAGISLLFHAYKIALGVTSEGVGDQDKTGLVTTWDQIRLIPQIIMRFLENMFLSGNWNIIWLIALLSCVHFARSKRRNEAALVLAGITLFAGLYVAMAALTTNYTWIAGPKNATTLSRLILHFFPLSVLLIALLNYDDDLGGR